MEEKIRNVVEGKGWKFIEARFYQGLGWTDEWKVVAERETTSGFTEVVEWSYIDGDLYYGKYKTKTSDK